MSDSIVAWMTSPFKSSPPRETSPSMNDNHGSGETYVCQACRLQHQHHTESERKYASMGGTPPRTTQQQIESLRRESEPFRYTPLGTPPISSENKLLWTGMSTGGSPTRNMQSGSMGRRSVRDRLASSPRDHLDRTMRENLEKSPTGGSLPLVLPSILSTPASSSPSRASPTLMDLFPSTSPRRSGVTLGSMKNNSSPASGSIVTPDGKVVTGSVKLPTLSSFSTPMM